MKVSQIQVFRMMKSEIHMVGAKWIFGTGTIKYEKVNILPMIGTDKEILGTQLCVDDNLIYFDNCLEDRVIFKTNFMLFSYQIFQRNFNE